MKTSTKKLQLEVEPKDISKDLVNFLASNINQFPGKSSLKFSIHDPVTKIKFGMYSMENGFEMNDEMANFLQQKPELIVQVELT
jgi:DNA polymerase-3 subunit alpha